MTKKVVKYGDPDTIVCPECGMPMTEVDPEGHALSHWPEHLDPAKSSKVARERQTLTLKGGISQAEYDARMAKGE